MFKHSESSESPERATQFIMLLKGMDFLPRPSPYQRNGPKQPTRLIPRQRSPTGPSHRVYDSHSQLDTQFLPIRTTNEMEKRIFVPKCTFLNLEPKPGQCTTFSEPGSHIENKFPKLVNCPRLPPFFILRARTRTTTTTTTTWTRTVVIRLAGKDQPLPP